VAELSGLTFALDSMPGAEEDASPAYRLLATSPTVRRLQYLTLDGGLPREGVTALANASSLDAVRRLTFNPSAPAEDVTRLTAAEWFQGVRDLRTHTPQPDVAVPLVARLGELPHLHTLDLPGVVAETVPQLAASRFRSLARLMYGGPLDRQSAAILAGAKF